MEEAFLIISVAFLLLQTQVRCEFPGWPSLWGWLNSFPRSQPPFSVPFPPSLFISLCTSPVSCVLSVNETSSENNISLVAYAWGWVTNIFRSSLSQRMVVPSTSGGRTGTLSKELQAAGRSIFWGTHMESFLDLWKEYQKWPPILMARTDPGQSILYVNGDN